MSCDYEQVGYISDGENRTKRDVLNALQCAHNILIMHLLLPLLVDTSHKSL